MHLSAETVSETPHVIIIALTISWVRHACLWGTLHDFDMGSTDDVSLMHFDSIALQIEP